MRVLWTALGGLVVGALAGLVWFLIILLMPSNIPNNADAGAGGYIILLFIGAVFATVGAVVGCLVGLFLGLIYHLAMGTASPRSRPKGRNPNPGKGYQPFDDLLD